METIGVIGGGLMGAGIAFTAASHGIGRVLLCEQDPAALDAARGRIDKLAARAAKRGGDAAEVATWTARVQFAADLEAFAEVDLAVEAVYEDLDLKRRLFAELDRVVPAPRPLCSNTSGLSISLIGGATQHPERVVGTHFFNPVPAMRLVEMVAGLATDEATVAAARGFCEGLGKETILVRDRPGFVVTRIGQAMMAEAVRCLEQGVATAEDIDRGMRLGYNYPLGPLELIDLIGVDTELKVMTAMFEELGETFRPSAVLKNMVAAGHLGRKSGRGFFDYAAGSAP